MSPHPDKEWRAIESAPRDGSEIVLGDRDNSYAGFWSTADCLRASAAPDGNWFEECDRGNEVAAKPRFPTHWMPFPDPPGTEEWFKSAPIDNREYIEGLLPDPPRAEEIA